MTGIIEGFFWVLKNNLKICGNARVSRLRSSANKVTCFAVVLIFNALHCVCFIKPVVRNVLTLARCGLLERFFLHFILFNPFWKSVRLGNSAWDFFQG